jgi:regulator of sigma E protease
MGFLGHLPALASWLFGYIVPFLFVLTIVVFFHEFGHFIVARWNGVRVLVFSIGFGPELFGFNDRHGTRWKVSAIPLGGFVKFLGDDNAASVPDQAAVAAMSEADKRDSFFHKHVAQRAAVVVAGPVANFILAILIFAGLVLITGKQGTVARIDAVAPGSAAAAAGFKVGDRVVAVDGAAVDSFADVERAIATGAGQPLAFSLDRAGRAVTVNATPVSRDEKDKFGNVYHIGRLGISGPTMPARIGSVQPGSAAGVAGFEADDVIEAIGGQPIKTFAELRDIVTAHPEQALSFKVARDGKTLTLIATPSAHSEKQPDGTLRRIGVLGVAGAFDPADIRSTRLGPFAALKSGVHDTWFIIDRTLSYLRDVVRGRESADQLGGPIRIAQVSGQVATAGFLALMHLAGVLSVSIGLLNLFPIPLLDGGHLLFYGIEAARGRPLSDRAQEIGFRIGLAIVLMLMVFATFNDILHLASS